jgi:4-amino-4-deoxy-L-arabinose transferase-like glycosyltransferase
MRVGSTRRDLAVGGILATAYLAILCATLDIGVSRDESFYFNAAEQYSQWYDVLVEDPAKAFTKTEVDRAFAYNGEHPALPKMLFGLSWRLFGKIHDPVSDPGTRHWYHRSNPPEPILGLMSESTAMRLPALLLASFLVFVIFLFGVEFFNRRVGLVAALAWMFQPHAFWHAHIACFDVPATAMGFITGYAFLRAVLPRDPTPRPGRRFPVGTWRWAILTGIAWGLALSTKHNAYFLPVTFLVWYGITRGRDFGLGRTPHGLSLRLPPVPLAFVAMLVVSPIVYYLTWPRLWFEPIKHLKWYIGFHAHHEFYWAYYWGTLFTKPPFPVSFPFVMSAMTMPGTTVVLSILGICRVSWEWIARRFSSLSGSLERVSRNLPVREPGVVAFVVLGFLVPFAVIAQPQTPIFGGTKHWLPGVPYLMILAGLAFELVLAALRGLGELVPVLGRRAARTILIAVTGFLFLAPAVFDTIHGYTNGTTYYNAFFGGFRAMGTHSMQREFWGNTAVSALPWLNDNAPNGARVDFHDTTFDAVRMYWREGKLRRDIQPVWDFKRADYFLFHWHKEFVDLEAEVRAHMGGEPPVHVVAQDGVPLLNVYMRPEKTRSLRKLVVPPPPTPAPPPPEETP